MQKIERYGVIALLFLLVTIVAVTFWNEDSKEPAPESVAKTAAPAEGGAAARPQNQLQGGQAQRPMQQGQNAGRQAGGPANRVGAVAPSDRSALPERTGSGAPASSQQGAPTVASLPVRSQNSGQQEFSYRPSETPSSPEPRAAGLTSPAERDPASGLLPVASTTSAALLSIGNPAGNPAGNPGATSARANATPPAAAGAPREVVVAAGDSLGRIAQRYLGDESLWQAIADENGIGDPKRLQVGQRLRLPGAGSIRGAAAPSVPVAPGSGSSGAIASGAIPSGPIASAASPSGPRPAPVSGVSRAYTVRPGEVLSVIAQRECGSVRALPSILSLNPGLNQDLLIAGQQILLPVDDGLRPTPGATPAAPTAQRSSTSQVASSAPPAGAARRNVVH
jgi:LysM repeat protein